MTPDARLSDAVFRDMLEAAPDAMVIVDERGRIVLVNAQAEALFGYGRDELLGAPVEMLVPERVRMNHAGHRHSFMVDPRTRPMGAGIQLNCVRKDGSEVQVEISLAPLETERGVLVSAAIRDATERERAAEAVRAALEREHEAAERLRNLDRMKNTFLHAVSHELRSPLAVVVGFADTLVEHRAALDEQQVTRMIEGIAKNAARLNQLLTDLLDLDRLARGVLEPNRVAADLGDVARRVLAEIDVGSHPVAVGGTETGGFVDPSKVERIIENLIVNAVRYSPDDAPIDVLVGRRDGAVLIEVADRGRGVPEAFRASIFNAFDRGEALPDVPGTGIGLSLVARFAELHGGRAWVEDREGGGSIFKVLLPDGEEA